MKIKTIRTRVFRQGEDLFSFVLENKKEIQEDSVLVLTSKIVSLSESRVVDIDPSRPVEKQREEIIKKESQWLTESKNKKSWITITQGQVMTSAGIDQSNADGKIILLPENPFQSAEVLRNTLRKELRIKNIGVLIVDSRTIPFRSGIMASALGFAGFEGTKSSKGKTDIFGRKIKWGLTNIADSLAIASVLCMGEAGEQTPLAMITNAPVEFTNQKQKSLAIDPRDDIYRPLFEKIKNIKPKK